MLPEDLASFPFLDAAAEYVSSLDFTLDALIRSKVFEPARKRGFDRLVGAMNGYIEKPSLTSENEVLTELLSYPYARILVSCLDEPAFIRKYAFSEALAAYETLHPSVDKHLDLVMETAEDLGISAYISDKNIMIHFTDYIRYSLTMRDIGWKMVNRHVTGGFVEIRSQEFVRLIQEAVRQKIESSLPLAIPEEIEELCRDRVDDLRVRFESIKKELSDAEFGEIEPLFFPPCITQALKDVRGGVNLAHSMRFALVAFLINIGMSPEEVIATFNVSPDFSEEKTRYQVEHIAFNEYKCPSCATMETYGNCPGKDRTCEHSKHPLGYYSRKLYIRRMKQNEAAENGSAENAPAGNTPAENAPAGNTPAENAPAENGSAENTSAGNGSAENTSAGNGSAENTPAENAPAGNTSAENTPAAGNSDRNAAPGKTSPQKR